MVEVGFDGVRRGPGAGPGGRPKGRPEGQLRAALGCALIVLVGTLGCGPRATEGESAQAQGLEATGTTPAGVQGKTSEERPPRPRSHNPLTDRETAARGEERAPVYGFRVVRSFPHDPNAFTQGLAVRGNRFYESTGLYGRSSVRIVEIETGRVLARRPLPPNHFGEGLALFGNQIYQLTWHEGICHVYDATTLDRLFGLEYEGEGWGLTHDGRHFVLSDGTSTLRFMHPDSFTVLRRLKVHEAGHPLERLNELEFVRGEIWANVWHSDRIARIDPETGRVLAWIDLTGIIDLRPDSPVEPQNVLNGIAYDPDNDRIFVTGKLWPRMFEIELVPPQ